MYNKKLLHEPLQLVMDVQSALTSFYRDSKAKWDQRETLWVNAQMLFMQHNGNPVSWNTLRHRVSIGEYISVCCDIGRSRGRGIGWRKGRKGKITLYLIHWEQRNIYILISNEPVTFIDLTGTVWWTRPQRTGKQNAI